MVMQHCKHTYCHRIAHLHDENSKFNVMYSFTTKKKTKTGCRCGSVSKVASKCAPSPGF